MYKLKINTLIFLFFCLTAAAQKNLVADGEFRTGTERLNGSISKPGNLVWYGQTKETPAGDGFQIEWIDLGYKQRVMHASFTKVSNRSTYLCQNITGFEPNKRYKTGFWMKTNDPGCALRVEIRAHNWENGRIVYNKKQLGSLEINPNKKNVMPETWQYYSFTINTQDIDEELLGFRYVRFLFFFNQSFASGKAVYHNPESGAYKYWITDVEVRELPGMITNNDFERWDPDEEVALSGWETKNATASEVKGWKETDKAVKLTSGPGKKGLMLSSGLSLKPGQKYTLSFWARSAEKGTVLTAGINQDGVQKKRIKLSDKWTQQQVSFRMPGAKSEQPVRITFQINEEKQAEIDHVIIE